MRHTEVVGLWRPTDAPPGAKTRVSRATDQGASHTSHAHKFVIKSTAMIRQSSLTRFIVNKKNNSGENAGRGSCVCRAFVFSVENAVAGDETQVETNERVVVESVLYILVCLIEYIYI